MNSGKFNTTTKIKISTLNGNVLKVTNYNVYEEPYEEYKIRPKCSICGGDVGCICYNYDNSDNPAEDATDGLLKRWCCEKAHCICEFLKDYNPEKYKELVKKYGDDEWSISEVLQEEFVDNDENIFCEV